MFANLSRKCKIISMKKDRAKFYLVLVGLFIFVLASNGCKKVISETIVIVPSVEGLKLSDAENVLAQTNLTLEVSSSEFSDSVQVDHIISQDPLAQSSVKSGSIIKVVISNGSSRVIVPDLAQKKFDEATIILKNLGLHIADISEVENDLPPGTIVSQKPLANTYVSPNTGIKVTVSLGIFIIIPDLIGLNINDAKDKIEKAGLALYKTIEMDVGPNIPSGIVLYQYPMPDQKVNQGAQITLKVSK